ncbi:MAG: hypothetical protein QOF25_4125, partial [Mycobacterium sp.]|nr:hypothetical protein [Mycobacterium sp.]
MMARKAEPPGVIDADSVPASLIPRTRRCGRSLSFKANYKAAYCLAVCPAGEEVIEPFLDDRKAFMNLVLKPLQD